MDLINTTLWEFDGPAFYEESSEPRLVAGSTTDYKLFLGGVAALDYKSGIRSRMSFNRGQNLRVSFRLWKPVTTESLDVILLGDLHWVYNSICGPWVNKNVYSGETENPTLEQIEAGFGQSGTNQNDNPDSNVFTRWCEGVTNWNGGGGGGGYYASPWMSAEFRDAWQAANTKVESLWIRIWLGDVSGAKAEWSTDGGEAWEEKTWETMKLQDGTTEIDTIGLPAGTDWNGATVGAADPVWLFFGPSLGDVYVDDVVVENDTHLIPVELSSFIIE
jgi:hypothetical protein